MVAAVRLNRNRLAQQRQAFLPDTHIEHADDLAFGILQRLICRDVPGVHHVGAAAVSLAGENCLDHRILRTVRHNCRDISADSALAVGCGHRGSYAKHVSGGVDTLEKRDGCRGLLGDVVDHRDGMIEAAVGSKRRAFQGPLRQSDDRVNLRELIQPVPGGGFAGDLDAARLLESHFAKAEAGVDRLLDKVLRELADAVCLFGAPGQAILHDADHLVGHRLACAALIHDHQDRYRHGGKKRR